MNFIRLLNAAFEKFYSDNRLNPTHISLYLALFQEWNSSRFAEEIYVNRQRLMQASKIGSKSTYHRCVRDLDSWGYITYIPSHNPYKGSQIKMAIIGTSVELVMGHYNPINGQVVYQHRPISGQALVSVINSNKQVNNIKQSKGKDDIFLFFKEKGYDADEGKKFFEYYEARNWQLGDGIPILNWKALATKWMVRAGRFTQESKANRSKVSQIKDNLRTTKKKDYGEPL